MRFVQLITLMAQLRVTRHMTDLATELTNTRSIRLFAMAQVIMNMTISHREGLATDLVGRISNSRRCQMYIGAYIDIGNQVCFSDLLTRVNHFHDSLIKTIYVSTTGFVDNDYRMYGDGDPYSIHFLIQSQSPAVCCFELVFDDVETMTLDLNYPLVPSVSFETKKIRFSLAQEPYSNRFMVVASRMRYRIIGKAGLGQTYQV